jgi:hypothetical protein
LRTISPNNARHLSRFSGILDLSGLERLTKPAAHALSNTEAELVFGDFAKLDFGAKQALSRYKGKITIKSEFFDISDYKLLSTYKSTIEFTELKTLTKSEAIALIGEHSNLLFNSLNSIPICQLSQCIAKHKGILDLPGITKISEEEAQVLAKHKGLLDLSGINDLYWRVAEKLAQHEGYSLKLTRLKHISVKSAKALSRYSGTLDLYGIKQLSTAQAKELAKHKSDLVLCSIKMTGISNEVASILTNKTGTIYGLYPSEWVKETESA